jgi:hypothetical protein
MRRGWKVLVAVGAVALFAGLLFLLPPRDDGLNWIRKYGPRESVSPFEWGVDTSSIHADPSMNIHTFQFTQIPREVEDLVRQKDRAVKGSEPELLSIDREMNEVSYVVRKGPSWLAERWQTVKAIFGLD